MWTAFDALARPDEKVELVARCELRAGFVRLYRRGRPVDFRFAGRTHAARSGRGGYAVVETLAPFEPGRHPFEVERGDAGTASVWVAPPDRPVLVTDLDQTVSRPTAFSFWWKHLDSIEPFEGAADVLRQASRTHTILYLTARWDIVTGKTRAWLRHNGFPPGPLVLRHGRNWSGSAGEYKRKAVGRIRSRWPVTCGIGDKSTDIAAYRANDVPALCFKEGGAGFQEGAAVCGHWSEIGQKVV